jgi:hypothetical protein
MATIKLPARALQRGDVTGSGETIVSVSAGVRTPAAKSKSRLKRTVGAERPCGARLR